MHRERPEYGKFRGLHDGLGTAEPDGRHARDPSHLSRQRPEHRLVRDRRRNDSGCADHDYHHVRTTLSGQTPFNGPHAIPGRVQAEDYDNGGANVAYYDTTAGNTGGTYRLNEAVDVGTINGITDIAYIADNEWTEYTVTVATGGTYTANFRVGSPKAGRTVVVTVDGAAGCTVNVPNTGSYSVYATASAPLTLTAGTHVIRLTYRNNEVSTTGQSIDSFELVGATTHGRADYGCADHGYRRRLCRPRPSPRQARRSARH